MSRGNIVHITTEVAPFYKRGGLGDVLSALPQHLAVEDFHNTVISLFYENKMNFLDGCQITEYEMVLNGFPYQFSCHQTEKNGVRYLFLELADNMIFSGLESSEDGDQPYKGTSTVMYYMYFAKAVLSILLDTKIYPNFVIAHDWQTAGIFLFPSDIEKLNGLNPFKSMILIHNYEYHGEIYRDVLPFLSKEAFEVVNKIFQKYRSASLLAIGIHEADIVATVSANYGRELMLGEVPNKGLKYIQSENIEVASFQNGVDYNIWHPARSPYISPYNFETVGQKKKNKQHVFELCQFGFEDVDSPLILMIARLTHQKGIQLIVDYTHSNEVIDQDIARLLQSGAKLIIFGTPSEGSKGDIHRSLDRLNHVFEGSVYYSPKYEEPLAHQFLAASDMLLSPSFFEPCGLTHLYAMAFGSIPVVRPVGGLKDTVNCYFSSPLNATGFYIEDFSKSSLLDTINGAVEIYSNEPQEWLQIQKRAMAQDFSWNKMRLQYVNYFEQVALDNLKA